MPDLPSKLLITAEVSAMGLVVGSFVTTAALRFAKGQAFIGGRSRCDGCGAELSFVRTVPLLSYVGQAGAASCCSGRIDPLHPSGELAGLAVSLSALFLASSPLTGVLIAFLGFLLLSLSVIDLRTGRLPDQLVILVAAVATSLSYLRSWTLVLTGLLSVCVTFAVLEGVRRAFLRLRGRGGLGGGDVKLLAALALWLGPLIPMAVVLASLLGLIQVWLFKPKDGRIAFGPAICVAGFVTGLAAPVLEGLL